MRSCQFSDDFLINSLINLFRIKLAGSMEPSTKVNVDFKPSKKMKKRRELDALVGGKQARPRRKSSSSHELLRSVDSESSDNEDYRIATPKTRGPCSLCSSCTSVLGILLLIACLLVCAGLTWMHIEMRKDLESLRMGLESVESRSEASVQDLNTYVVKLSDVNKTVHSIQTGKNSLNDVINNISSMNNEISELSHTVNKLSAGLETAPELRQIPDKLQTVSRTVADLGSEFTVVKEQVESFAQFMKTANTKLDELSNQVTEIDTKSKTATEADLNPDLAHLIQNVPTDLNNLNISLMTQLSLLQSTLIEHEQKLGMLENTTATLSKNLPAISHPTMPAVPGPTTGDLKAQVDELLQEMMKNTSSPVNDVGIGQKTMTQLLSNMDNLTTTVEKLKDNYKTLIDAKTGTDSVSTNSDDELVQLLNTYEEGFNHKIMVMNTSMTDLQHDLDHYGRIIGQHSNQLVNIIHQVNELQRFISQPVNQSKASSQTTKSPIGEQTTTMKPPSTVSRETEIVTEPPPGGSSTTHGRITEKGSTVMPMKKESPGDDTGEDDKPPPAPEEPTAKPTTLENGHDRTTKNRFTIVVPFIHNMADLELNFRRWDINGQGKVIYDMLHGYLGSSTPTEEQLRKFDKNGDKLYSLSEFADAFGFNMDDLPPDSPFREHNQDSR